MRRGGTSEAAPAAVRQAVGGGCQSGWGRLLSVTNAIEAGTWRQETVAGHRLGALEGGGSPLAMHPWGQGTSFGSRSRAGRGGGAVVPGLMQVSGCAWKADVGGWAMSGGWP